MSACVEKTLRAYVRVKVTNVCESNKEVKTKIYQLGLILGFSYRQSSFRANDKTLRLRGMEGGAGGVQSPSSPSAHQFLTRRVSQSCCYL